MMMSIFCENKNNQKCWWCLGIGMASVEIRFVGCIQWGGRGGGGPPCGCNEGINAASTRIPSIWNVHRNDCHKSSSLNRFMSVAWTMCAASTIAKFISEKFTEIFNFFSQITTFTFTIGNLSTSFDFERFDVFSIANLFWNNFRKFDWIIKE